MPADAGEPIGLRERKRRATENAIEEAAVRIALAEGIEAVTVDRISADAQISRSTFFNYFPARDAAIFGRTIELEPGPRLDGILEQWATALPIGLAIAVFESIGSSRMHSEVARLRHELIHSHPELADRIAAEVFGARRHTAAIVEDWFERHPQYQRLGDARRDAVTVVDIAMLLAEELYSLAMSKDGDVEVELPELLDAYERVCAAFTAYTGPGQG